MGKRKIPEPMTFMWRLALFTIGAILVAASIASMDAGRGIYRHWSGGITMLAPVALIFAAIAFIAAFRK
jgi:hypothetical protein